MSQKVAEGTLLATQRRVSNPACKIKPLPGHISPTKPALVTILEEDENDLDVRKETAVDYWERDDHKATLEEDSGVEACCIDDDPNVLRCVDLQTVEESVESSAEHMLRGEQEVSFKCTCLEDGEEVMEEEKGGSIDNFSRPEYREDKHLKETEDNYELGEYGDNTGSPYQTAASTLPEEVLRGLRGLDGAILLLQKARLDLLCQVLLLTIYDWAIYEL